MATARRRGAQPGAREADRRAQPEAHEIAGRADVLPQGPRGPEALKGTDHVRELKKQPFIEMAQLSTLIAEGVEIPATSVQRTACASTAVSRATSPAGQPATARARRCSCFGQRPHRRQRPLRRCGDQRHGGRRPRRRAPPRAAIRCAGHRDDPLPAAADGRRRATVRGLLVGRRQRRPPATSSNSGSKQGRRRRTPLNSRGPTAVSLGRRRSRGIDPAAPISADRRCDHAGRGCDVRHAPLTGTS